MSDRMRRASPGASMVSCRSSCTGDRRREVRGAGRPRLGCRLAADAAMQGIRPAGRPGTGIRPPVGRPDDSWLDDLEAVEESLDLLRRPYMYLRRCILVDVRHALDYPVRVVLRGCRGNAVRDGQV